MLKITIDKNGITREVGFDLRFQAPISYKEFCANPEYESILDKDLMFWSKHIFTIRSFWTGWGYKDMKPYQLVFEDLLEHSYVETFTNVYEPRYFKFLPENGYNELTNGNVTDPETLDFNLNYIKYCVTNNKYFYYAKEGEISQNANLLTPSFIENLKANRDEDTKMIKRHVKFSQKQIDNKMAPYLLFLSIVSDMNLFIIINPHNQSYVITDDVNLHAITPLYCLCINVRNGLDAMINDASLGHIQAIKDKYKHLNSGNKTIKVFQDIQEAINTKASWKITIDVNKGNISYLDGKFRDQDLSKIHDYKGFMNTGNITASTTIEEHKGKPTAIVGHRRKRYDK